MAILLRLGQDNPLNPVVFGSLLLVRTVGKVLGAHTGKLKWVRFFGVRGESNPRVIYLAFNSAHAKWRKNEKLL